VHVVIDNHFRSRKKDGVQAIRSSVGKNPTLHAHLTALCVLQTPSCWRWKGICNDMQASTACVPAVDLFQPCHLGLDPIIFIREPDP